MITQLNCDEFLDLPSVCIDVRSPSEFSEGAIINAKNIPLLDDENRKYIGICYKQAGKDEAIALGYQLVNPVRHTFIEQLETISGNKEIKLYCARGGLRSNKMAEFLSASGYHVAVLKGGYKTYRSHALNTISRFTNLFILSGNTGCGKTEILEELRLKGEQVLNLEKLANHKGSAFGAIGEKAQPTNNQFSNLLFENLKHYNPERRLWVESESFKIGRVGLPEELWRNMVTANGIEIVIPTEKRVDYIISRYGKFDKALLKNAVLKISRHLGSEKEALELCDKIDRDELHGVVNRLLKYYDKGYIRSREKTNCQNFVKFNLETTNAVMNSELLLQHLQVLNHVKQTPIHTKDNE